MTLRMKVVINGRSTQWIDVPSPGPFARELFDEMHYEYSERMIIVDPDLAVSVGMVFEKKPAETKTVPWWKFWA